MEQTNLKNGIQNLISESNIDPKRWYNNGRWDYSD